MPLAHIEFQPKLATLEARVDLQWKLDWYGGCLWMDGRIGDHCSTVWTGKAVRLSVYFLGSGCVSSGVKCSYTRKALAEVHKLAKLRAKWVVTKSWCDLDDTARWQRAPSLVLAVPRYTDNTPVRHGGNWRCVPVCTLPLPDLARERLTGWNSDMDALYRVWMDSGALEFDAAAEMADCRGQIMTTAREFAAGIEEATGVPTYVELFRYCCFGDNESKRRCPGCGGSWLRKKKGYGIASFEFRCDRCRVVSEIGIGDEIPKEARRGEWRAGRKPIESAASIRNRVRRGTLIL